MKRRKPAHTAEPTPERVPIPPAPDEPVWAELPQPQSRSYTDFSTMTYRTDTIVMEWQWHHTPSNYVLPPFQRNWASEWDAARCCAYLNSLLTDAEQTPIVLWKVSGTDKTYLLDGQHRLVTLGAHVVDSHGQQRIPPAVCFDLAAARWLPGDGDGRTTFPRSTMMLATRSPFWRNPQPWASDAFQDAMFAAGGRFCETYLTITRMLHSETPDAWRRALNYFDHMHKAVPFNHDEREAMRVYVAALPTEEESP